MAEPMDLCDEENDDADEEQVEDESEYEAEEDSASAAGAEVEAQADAEVEAQADAEAAEGDRLEIENQLRDSLATLVGALVGARRGLGAIPAEWVASVERSDTLLGLAAAI